MGKTQEEEEELKQQQIQQQVNKNVEDLLVQNQKLSSALDALKAQVIQLSTQSELITLKGQVHQLQLTTALHQTMNQTHENRGEAQIDMPAGDVTVEAPEAPAAPAAPAAAAPATPAAKNADATRSLSIAAAAIATTPGSSTPGATEMWLQELLEGTGDEEALLKSLLAASEK